MFVGRDYQIDLLSSVWDKDSSSLVVVSGRRRIGKSTLVERFAENIRRMCFLPEGYLFKDFDSIFSDVFGDGIAAKRRILDVLANGPASVSELARAMSIEPNGHISDDLSDLATAGFVSAGAGLNPITGTKVREVRYRLCDNYTRFYLKFIQPRREAIRQGLYRFTDLESLPGWKGILGLQFENLVVNNLAPLCREIGLGRKLVTSAAPYARRKSATCPGLQIDLLIQTPKSIYVVEVKRCNRIEASIESEISEKVARLGVGPDKSVRTALVYDGHLSPEVEENGFIDFLIPFSRLMKASAQLTG
ncbi:MAG: ATP-binding protein [Kiritimatiellae bacterium]|nr:ATP-binding protein [Kiritimatiellia bacterium]